MAFVLTRPAARPAPVVVEIPHAGTDVPDDIAAAMWLDEHAVRRDADLYVDELYANAPSCGAVMLVARTSRYVIDLNRHEEDVDPHAVDGAAPSHVDQSHGLIWTVTTGGFPALRRPLTPREFASRVETYYRPYHRALDDEILGLRARFGHVIVVAAHSMPSCDRLHATEGKRRRADVVPGTRGRTSASPAVIDAVDAHFRSAGLSVRHDDPYRGGATTQRWGRPRDGVHVVQIELNRALYMDEATLERRPEGCRWLASLCQGLIAHLVDVVP